MTYAPPALADAAGERAIARELQYPLAVEHLDRPVLLADEPLLREVTEHAIDALARRSKERRYLPLGEADVGPSVAADELLGEKGQRSRSQIAHREADDAPVCVLEGYRGSRPVRTGNGAASQFQLDIYGEVLDTAHLWRKFGGSIDPEFWVFLRGCVECIGKRWRDPDEGIWEVRGGSRHFVYSKAMCWVGVDRAIKMAGALSLEAPVDDWRALRDEIRRDVLERGFDTQQGAFVQAYGSHALDASALLLPLVGFLRPGEPRVRSTVDAVRRHLERDGLVYRYLTEDGLPGGEGAFTICSFWLADNLALLGDEEARALFERVCSRANDVGLFGEQIDPATGEHLGNFPQAFTHMALINSAVNLQRRAAPTEEGERPCLDETA